MMGLIRTDQVKGGFVVREKDAYPAYYQGYESHYTTLKNYVRGLENAQMIGRAAMFKYGNQDHATISGILAARNLLGEQHDVWSVLDASDYLETDSSKST